MEGQFMANQRDDDEEAVLAKDDLDDKDTEQLLADGEMVGTWSDNEEDDDTLLAGDESIGPWSEDDLEFGLKASDTEVEVEVEDSADVEGDEDIDQLSDMPDPRARR
jgi:hypothetical protein